MEYRWSSDQDSRRQRGPAERQGSRSHSRERAQDGSHLPPLRPPSWKRGPSPSSYHQDPEERPLSGPRKRMRSDIRIPPSDGPEEYESPKHPRPQPFNVARPFGGKPLSFRDKSFLVRSRQVRAESLMKLKLPPYIKPRLSLGGPVPRGSISSVLAFRKKRFQSNVPLSKLEPREKPERSTSKEDSTTKSSSRDSDSSKEQVESHRALNKRRYGIFLLALFAGAWWWLGGRQRMCVKMVPAVEKKEMSWWDKCATGARLMKSCKSSSHVSWRDSADLHTIDNIYNALKPVKSDLKLIPLIRMWRKLICAVGKFLWH